MFIMVLHMTRHLFFTNNLKISNSNVLRNCNFFVFAGWKCVFSHRNLCEQEVKYLKCWCFKVMFSMVLHSPVICSSQITSTFQILTSWEIVNFCIFSGWKCVFFPHWNLCENELKLWFFLFFKVMCSMVHHVTRHLFFTNNLKISNSNVLRNCHFLRFRRLKMRFFLIKIFVNMR